MCSNVPIVDKAALSVPARICRPVLAEGVREEAEESLLIHLSSLESGKATRALFGISSCKRSSLRDAGRLLSSFCGAMQRLSNQQGSFEIGFVSQKLLVACQPNPGFAELRNEDEQ
jgi:hypothetical protein